MRNTAAKLTFIILAFNVTFINSRMVIPKEDVIFETRAKPKINIQLRWISLFSNSIWIKTTTASDLCYELAVNAGK